MAAINQAVYTDSESRWEAVARRDRSADGAFFYSVASTGVYCRPSCAARLPRRENVRFHETASQAERAGFRACRRCRPNEQSLDRRQSEVVAAACRSIDESFSAPSLAELARSAGISPFHFHRVFKKITGVTPKAYAEARKARRVRLELAEGAAVTEAIYAAGYGSSSRFYSGSGEHLGMTPSAYRSGGKGATIRFAIGESSLGSILVAATDKGVCSILLGDDPEALARDLQDRFPGARLIGGDREFERTVALAVGLVEDPAAGLDLPLDIRGTAFQQRVWEALQRIPAGSTATYSSIAKEIGQSGAVRAVARACAANPIAVAVPCHRVVRTDGSLSGYRWGVERKQELLKRERASGDA